LYNGEEYYLQIDSHCKFIKNWDKHLIKMIQDLKKEGIPKPVLSHYTPTFESYNEEGAGQSITTICESWFTDQNLISLKGAGWVEPGRLPKPNAYIAAGMFFCEAKFLEELPFDPELDFLFIGEELLLSVRFFTHGWDIFTPNKNTIYHLYTREHEPKYWENRGLNADQASQKVRYLLGLDTDKSKLTERQVYSLQFYGLGSQRSLEDYYEYSGIDIKKKQILKNMCNWNPEDSKKTVSVEETKTCPHHKKPRHWMLTFFYILLLVLLSLVILRVVLQTMETHLGGQKKLIKK